MHDKPTLRQLMRERLRAIAETTRQQASARIAQHILSSGKRQHAETAPPQVIAIFGGLGMLAAYLYERKNPPTEPEA